MVDSDVLLKREMVTLTEALMTTNNVVLLAILVVSTLVSDSHMKVLDIIPDDSKVVSTSDVLNILQHSDKAAIGFGAGFSVKALDEELLRRGLVLNDDLQSVLAKHDAIASGSPLPQQPVISNFHTSSASAPYEEDEAEDDFAQLARRRLRTKSIDQQDSAGQTNLAGQLALPPLEDVANKSSKISDQLALPEPP